MELHVEKLSRQTIKPAAPTPPHLKLHKLSLLDQLSPLVYGHQITCYFPAKNKGSDDLVDSIMIITNLKDSLARALSIYYPLAGRLTSDESAIDCNDEGIPFVEARVQSTTLSSFLLQSAATRVDMIPYFLPHISSLAISELVMFAIQVTMFECGGVIIGVKGLHKSHDGCSSGNFVSCWADIVAGRRIDNEHYPDFTAAAATFPPRTWAAVSPPRPPVSLSDVDRNKVDGTCVVKVFEFTSLSLSALQGIARSDTVPNPTRIEAVSGFIWKHCMAAAASASSASHMFGPSVITHAVNIRHRLKPKLSPEAFGNLVVQAQASCHAHQKTTPPTGPELSDLVARIRAGLSQVKDVDFLSKLQGEEGGEAIRKYNQNLVNLRNEITNINTYRFFSWCGLGMVQDFGLGTPKWVGYSGGRMSSTVKNIILLIENNLDDGHHDGIEAWLTLDEKDMDMLVSDPKFLEFASGSTPLHSTRPDPTKATSCCAPIKLCCGLKAPK